MRTMALRRIFWRAAPWRNQWERYWSSPRSPRWAAILQRSLAAEAGATVAFSATDYIITWAVGHLVALASPEELDDKYKNWTRADLPILPKAMKLKVLPRVKRQYDVVSGWMNHEDVDSIICATDSGREGELIFRLIYIMAGCTKPFQRLWISSMTDEAIREGFERLRPGSDYDTLYHSAKCRSEADWLVGMNGSRALRSPMTRCCRWAACNRPPWQSL